MFYTSTKNYKGGVNNLYVAEYYQGKCSLVVGTSLKSMEQAVINCKRNFKRNSSKILGF